MVRRIRVFVAWLMIGVTTLRILGFVMGMMVIGMAWAVIMLVIGTDEHVSTWIYVAGLVIMTAIFMGCGRQYLQCRREIEAAEWSWRMERWQW